MGTRRALLAAVVLSTLFACLSAQQTGDGPADADPRRLEPLRSYTARKNPPKKAVAKPPHAAEPILDLIGDRPTIKVSFVGGNPHTLALQVETDVACMAYCVCRQIRDGSRMKAILDSEEVALWLRDEQPMHVDNSRVMYFRHLSPNTAYAAFCYAEGDDLAPMTNSVSSTLTTIRTPDATIQLQPQEVRARSIKVQVKSAIDTTLILCYLTGVYGDKEERVETVSPNSYLAYFTNVVPNVDYEIQCYYKSVQGVPWVQSSVLRVKTPADSGDENPGVAAKGGPDVVLARDESGARALGDSEGKTRAAMAGDSVPASAITGRVRRNDSDQDTITMLGTWAMPAMMVMNFCVSVILVRKYGMSPGRKKEQRRRLEAARVTELEEEPLQPGRAAASLDDESDMDHEEKLLH